MSDGFGQAKRPSRSAGRSARGDSGGAIRAGRSAPTTYGADPPGRIGPSSPAAADPPRRDLNLRAIDSPDGCVQDAREPRPAGCFEGISHVPDRRTTTPATRRERRRLERDARPPGHTRRGSPAPAPRWAPSIAVVSLLAVLFGAGAIAAFQLAGPGSEPSTGAGQGTLLVPPATIPSSVAVDGEFAGRPDAPVLVEVYGDYQCPVCARFAREYLGRLVADFVMPGDISLVDRSIAFLGTGDPDESEQAAIGAACAGEQGAYWTFHDLLLWNQRGENQGAFAAERLAAMADAAALDRAAWDACVADPERVNDIRRATADAAAIGITSTPTIVIDGQRIVGMSRTYDELASAVRAALATGSAP